MDPKINAVEIMNAFAEKRLKDHVHAVHEKFNNPQSPAQQDFQVFDDEYQLFTQELEHKVHELEESLGKSDELTGLIGLYQTKFLNNQQK